MSTLRTMVRTVVNDCYLQFPDKDDIKMPVSRFKATFALDTIPIAEVVPSLGRELSRGVRVSLNQIAEGDAVQLWLKVDGTLRLIMEGVVATISGSDNATIFNRRLTATIAIKHKAVALAGAPSASFAYTSAQFLDTTPLSYLQSNHPLFGAGRDQNLHIMALDSFNDIIETEFGSLSAALFPSTILRHIATELMSSYSYESEEEGSAAREEVREEVESFFLTYDPANFSNLPSVTSIGLLKSFVSKYTETWNNSNNWEALVNTAKYLFLHIVPFNRGFYLANPLSLMRTPSVLIRTKHYISLAQQLADDLVEPIDGVVLRPPVPDIENFQIVFPKPDPAGEDSRAELRYYHYREYPDWVHEYVELSFGPLTSQGVSEVERAAAQLPDRGDQNLRETYREVGEKLAQAIYADLKAKKAAVRLQLPYREDLMPGTIVSIVSTGAEDMSFIGDTLYAMIHKTDIVCDMLQEKGQLNTYIDVVSVRNSEDNNSDNLTMAEHPVYEAPWAGIDLFGEFSLDVGKPDSQTPPPGTNNANVKGTVVPKNQINAALGQ